MLPPWGSLSSCSFSQKPLQSSGRAERQGFHRLRRARQNLLTWLHKPTQRRIHFITFSSSVLIWSPHLRGCIPLYSIVVLVTSVGGEREMETNSRDSWEEDPPVCMLQAAEVCGPESFTSCVSPASVSQDFFFPTALCWFRATTKNYTQKAQKVRFAHLTKSYWTA